MTSIRDLVRRGVNRPDKIPRYLWGLLPVRNWGPTWRIRDGVVTFEPGGFASSPRTRPEFASNLYREVRGLRSILTEYRELPVERSLEVGCGYGRLSPWIAEVSVAHHAIDPDGGAIRLAAEHYPWIGFVAARAQELPYPDGRFDLVIAWTVLQHIPDETIDAATAELSRVLSPGGLAICCERVDGERGPQLRPRPVDEYDRLFSPLERVGVRERSVEPTWKAAMGGVTEERVLVYRSSG